MVSNLVMNALSLAVAFALLPYWAQGATPAQGAKLSVEEFEALLLVVAAGFMRG